MHRLEKKDLVAKFQSIVSTVESLIVVNHVGLTASETFALRREMRASDARFLVIKNRLAKIALAETKFCDVVPLLTGPTGLVYSSSVVSGAKAISNFAKTNEKIAIKGGSIGSGLLSTHDIETLAKMPDLDTLRGQILASLAAVSTKIVRILKEPQASLVRVIAAKE